MKTFVSTIERWPGKVLTNEWMTWPQLELWEVALKAAQKVNAENDSVIQFYSIMLPIALEIVKEWDIQGLSAEIKSTDDLPASVELIAFIVESISKLFADTNAVSPN